MSVYVWKINSIHGDVTSVVENVYGTYKNKVTAKSSIPANTDILEIIYVDEFDETSLQNLETEGNISTLNNNGTNSDMVQYRFNSDKTKIIVSTGNGYRSNGESQYDILNSSWSPVFSYFLTVESAVTTLSGFADESIYTSPSMSIVSKPTSSQAYYQRGLADKLIRKIDSTENKTIYGFAWNPSVTFNLNDFSLKNEHGDFSFMTKLVTVDPSIKYLVYTIKDKDFTHLSSDAIAKLNTLNNSTHVIEIHQYDDTNAKVTDEMVTVEIQNWSHSTAAVFHISDGGEVKEINETNFPGSSVSLDTSLQTLRVTSLFSEIVVGSNITSTPAPTPTPTPTPVPSTPTGGSSGDPHVFPMEGKPFELPMKEGSYRMLQGKGLYMNANTRPMTKEESKEITRYYAKHFPGYENKVLKNGYFYEKVFIYNEGGYLVYDFEKDEIEASSKMNFTSRKQIAHKDSLGEYEKDVFVSERVLTFYNKFHGSVKLVLRQFTNPYLKYGFALSMDKKRNATGLIVRESSAKHMEVESLVSTQTTKEVFQRNQVYTVLNKNMTRR